MLSPLRRRPPVRGEGRDGPGFCPGPLSRVASGEAAGRSESGKLGAPGFVASQSSRRPLFPAVVRGRHQRTWTPKSPWVRWKRQPKHFASGTELRGASRPTFSRYLISLQLHSRRRTQARMRQRVDAGHSGRRILRQSELSSSWYETHANSAHLLRSHPGILRPLPKIYDESLAFFWVKGMGKVGRGSHTGFEVAEPRMTTPKESDLNRGPDL
jgi:hypothetical protein